MPKVQKIAQSGHTGSKTPEDGAVHEEEGENKIVKIGAKPYFKVNPGSV